MSRHLISALAGTVLTALNILITAKLVAADPALLGQWPPHARDRYNGGGRLISVDGVTAHLIADNDLIALDVRNSAKPSFLHKFDLRTLRHPELPDFGDVGAARSGQHLFVAVPQGLAILDVNNPKAPIVVGKFETDEFRLIRGQRLSFAGSRVYINKGVGLSFPTAQLDIYDVSDLTHPVRQAAIKTLNVAGPDLHPPGEAEAFGLLSPGPVSGNFGYFYFEYPSGDSWVSGIQLMDLTTPSQPIRLGVVKDFSSADLMFAPSLAWAFSESDLTEEGRWFYKKLTLFDISNPSLPVLLAERNNDLFDSVGEVVMSGNLGFFTSGAWQEGLKIFNLSNPASPVLVGRYPVREWAHGVKVSGQHAYLMTSDGFEVIDVSRPEQPVRVGIYDALVGHAWDVHVQGDHAYLADGAAGLRIIDVKSRTAPVERRRFATPAPAVAVRAAGNLVYVADGDLKIINVADPASPKLAGTLETPGAARSVEVVANLAFIADDSPSGPDLLIADSANPTSPVLLGTYGDTDDRARSVYVAGNFAFLSGQSFLKIFDVADPKLPKLLSSYKPQGFSGNLDVVISRNLAVLTSRISGGVEFLDVSDPATPRRMGGYCQSNGSWCQSFRAGVSGNRTFLMSYPFGFDVLDVTEPTQPVAVGQFRPPWGWGSYAEDAGHIRILGDVAYIAAGLLGIVDARNSLRAPALRIGRDTSGIELRLSGAAGETYRVESAPLLRANVDWQPMATVTSTNDTERVRISIPDGTSSRFYRVVGN